MPIPDPADAPQPFPPIGAPGAHGFFAQLLQHTPAPIYVASPDGRYLFVNRAWEVFGGVPAGRVLGRPVGELYSAETARRLREANRRVLTSGAPLTLEDVVETATGVRHFHTVKFPVRDAAGAVVAVGGVSIDITERKRAEDAARAAEARGRELLDGSPDGVAVFRNQQVAYANQAFCALLGYDRPEELVGQSGADLLTEACREQVARNARDRAAGLPVPSCYEVECLRRDGGVVPAELHIRLIEFDGAPSSLSHVRDITGRKRAEEALRDYAGRLQALSRRLQEVQEQERRRLARELHDEVGQILTGLDLTLKNGGRLGDDGLRAAVGEAREMLRDLTARVRDLSLRLRPSMLDDLGLAPALEWHLGRFTAQTGVRVAFRHAGLGRRFSPEGETAAYRIVQEALTNVARHSGATEAEVRISLDGGRFRLEIEDRGSGFDAAAPKADACCGVSGMRQRAALRGGRLDVESALGAGTRLTAEWPEDPAGGHDGADAARR